MGPYQCENFIERQKCDEFNQGEENNILVELPISHIDNNNSEEEIWKLKKEHIIKTQNEIQEDYSFKNDRY